MNKFRITLTTTYGAGMKKIQDIKDFREMTRNPFTGECATLTSAKFIVESIYEKGSVEIEVSPEDAATILSNWMKPEFCPDGWDLSKSEAVKVEPQPLTIEYYSRQG